jgi:hypothetical protein
MKASPMSIKAPKVAMQGGMAKANVQPAKIQAKAGAKQPGSATMNYSKQPSGTRGTNKGAK